MCPDPHDSSSSHGFQAHATNARRAACSPAVCRTEIASNDNWSPADATVFQQVGAFALPPGSKDAALVRVLGAGAYTAQASGLANSTGVALVEVYELP